MKLSQKIHRYRAIVQYTYNPLHYILQKALGKDRLTIHHKTLGMLSIHHSWLGPFKENIFDEVYFKYIQPIPPDGIVIDIGANAGFFTLATFTHWPSVQVLSYEPYPQAFDVLNHFYQLFKSKYSWKIYKTAVGSKEFVYIHQDANSRYSTTTQTHLDAEGLFNVVKVPCISLEQIILQVKRISLLKMDCEGAEFDILTGLPDYCFSAIDQMVLEVHENHPHFKNNLLESILSLHNFKIIKGASQKGTYLLWAARINSSQKI